MIGIEEIQKKDIDAFWALHWEYLNRDVFDADDTEEDRAYFLSEAYRGTIAWFMDRIHDKIHLAYFVRDGVRIGCAQYVTYKSEDGKCFILDFWVFRNTGETVRGTAVLRRFPNMPKKTARSISQSTSQVNARQLLEKPGF